VWEPQSLFDLQGEGETTREAVLQCSVAVKTDNTGGKRKGNSVIA